MLSQKRMVVVVVALALLASGCVQVSTLDQKSQEAVIVPGTPNVTIENFNGNVEVVTGPEGKVSAEVRKYAENAEDLAKISFAFSQSGADVQARAAWNGGDSVSNAGVDLQVRVPPGSTVSVTNGNGNVDYRAEPGQAIAVAVGNGETTINLPRDAQFAVKAAVGNGQITSDFPLSSGDVQNETRLEGSTGGTPGLVLALTTGNGNIAIKAAR